MQARLKVLQDNANLKQVKLLPITVIGRAADCQLKIASTQVSRKHCRLTVTDKEVLVEDLNSANGTYVNQEKIPAGQPVAVAPGATLHIGPAAFVVDYTPPLTLETMPTTVIKSSELPFLKGAAKPPALAVAVPPIVPVPVDAGSDVLAAELPVAAPPVSEESHPPADDKSGEESEIIVGPVTFPSEETIHAKLSGEETVSIRPPEAVIPTPSPIPEPAAPKFEFAAQPQVLAEPPKPTPVVASIPAAPVTAPIAAPVAKPVAAPALVVAKAVPATPAAPPPAVPSPPAATEALPSFNFLGGEPVANAPASFGGFDFSAPAAAVPVAPATPEPASAPVAKVAAPKKSLFGLFGKKPADAPATEAVAAAPAESVPPPPPAATVPEPAIAIPAFPAPAEPAAPPAASDDPFAFLR